ncbi:acyl-CoA dehydrogenase family protein [Mycobacterium gordonae]|uniref:Acyl-CoA dehydrogenase n=1 Tax=Mycobacterium gordonae TaxID=1778 RepID=A0A1X1W887_MYCGO|nr:acyl-CoA dehydrogenase family protein [Mycobacterium gordonae]MCQ4361224.1 acyl-CoA/acyl-ACP dehydrogenase [Mycobacterium gordonae]MCV7004295.1 acyl-CoA dehydrogenase family protein [Mycobacterium gordonae]ODR22001.1 acyl-CoA dehydrogenase [Mycobacterium gordonae]ORV82796.1 acyl-CoA dehydrogenase [Mycobacterium gordonae]
MNLELDDEQVALADTVRRFLAERASISGHVRPMLDDPTGTTEAVWRGLADLGATGVLVPAEFGGAGMTMVEAGIVAEELGAALHSGPWLSTAVAATRMLTAVGGQPAAEMLAGIAAGTAVVTVLSLGEQTLKPLVSARNGGFSVCSPPVAAPDAAAADVLLVSDGTGLFAIEAAAPGVTVTAERGIDQTRKHFQVQLDNASAQRLGTVSAEDVQAVTDDVLIAAAADALGAATAVMKIAIDYAKTRNQFGAPIGSFQAIQHLCVDMFETVELARSGVIHALWAAADSPGDRHLAAARAKAFAGRLATVGDTAIQIFGGIGYTWDHDAHLYLKRLLNWSALGGGADRYLTEIGALLAEKGRDA